MTEAPTLHIAPPPFLDDPALQAVLAALPRARVVGGAVRDAVAGRPVSDIDLATPDPPDAVIHALGQAGLKHAPTGLQHGTVTAISGGCGFEVTTLRTDERTDGRHAEVAWTTDWQQDAARRDFTINAMSMRPDGAVFDYFGGLPDLHAGRLRFVGDPARRIEEDYLRVLRFFRFYARYAAHPPDAATTHALRHAVPALPRLSTERVWSELKRILATPEPVQALVLMDELGILDVILPGAKDLAAFTRLVQAGAPPDPLLRLTALYPAAPDLAGPMKLSRPEAQTLAALAGPAPDPAWSAPELRRALTTASPAALIGRTWLQPQSPEWAALRSRIAATPTPVFPLHGRDALAFGLPAGPEIGLALEAVRHWWLEGGCVADAAACRAQLASRVAR